MSDPEDIPPFSAETSARVLNTVLTKLRRRRRIRDVTIGVAAGVAAATVLGGAAAIVVLAPLQQRAREVSCYQAADLSSPVKQGERNPDETVTNAAGYAVEFCSALWTAGLVDPAITQAPPLELCVRSDGLYLVFPEDPTDTRDNPTFCDDLGLLRDPRG